MTNIAHTPSPRDEMVASLKRLDAQAAQADTKRSRPRRDAGDAKEAQETEAKSSAATTLAEHLFAAGKSFWHSPSGDPYMTVVHGDGVVSHIRIDSSDGTEFAQRIYYLKEAKAISQDAVKAAINTVAAHAKYAGDEHEVFARIAHQDQYIWVDLGDPSWRAVRIDRDGYRVVDSAAVPVKFRRSRSTRALPEPQDGGSLNELRALFEMDDPDWMLVIGWLLGVFQEDGGRAHLELIGQQGSGKSTLARMLARLTDPAEILLRSVPRNEEDLMIAVQSRAVIAFDNVSHLQPGMSDNLCTLSTGGGFATRKLYANREEESFAAQLPVMLTSIVPVTLNRPDLQERTLTIRLESLDTDTYRSEREINAVFNEMWPRLTGALYTAVSAALRNRETVALESLPRLADFATWGEAGAPAFGWEAGAFTAALEASGMTANMMAVDASPVGRIVYGFMQDTRHWEGSVSDLLVTLRELASDDDKRQRQFPKDSARLGIQLRRMQRPLASLGVWVGFGRSRRSNVVILDRNDDIYGRDAEPDTEAEAQQAELSPTLPAGQSAIEWLGEQLAIGPRVIDEMHAAARSAGIDLDELNDARRTLGVRTVSIGARWHWTLEGAA